jgi:hypothetical protein
MKDTANELRIKQTESDLRYYKQQRDLANGSNRKSYEKSIKLLETHQQLAILKERNISN